MFHSHKPRSYKGNKSTAYLLQSNTIKNRSPVRAQGARRVNVVCAILYPSLVLNDFMQNIYQKLVLGRYVSCTYFLYASRSLMRL
jgi:hypothetical protein